jgi:signal transduction histidine kinase
MVSKRDLGVSYLLGLGLGLVVSLLGYVLLVDGSLDPGSVGVFTAIGLASSLPYLGHWLERSALSDAAVWTVARWSAIGIAAPTLFASGMMFVGIRPRVVLQFPHLLVNLVAAGGVFGALLGVVTELRRQYDRVDELNRRNRILNQVMRHDIRNDVNVIEARAELLAEQAGEVDEELIEPIQRKSREIAETSTLAGHIQTLEEGSGQKPIDVVTLVTDCVGDARDAYPRAEIDTDLPDRARVEAGELLRTVVDNLVENAIEHNDGSPRVTVGVDTPENGGWVRIRVADNGPGIPERSRQIVSSETTPSTASQSGLGLRLVGWFVDHYNGTITFDNNEPRGTEAVVTLPAYSPENEASTANASPT